MVNDGYVTYRGDNQGTIALDPAVQAAQRLTELLRARGVEVAKPARRAVAPSDAHDVVAPLESAPVSAVVAEMLGASDNDTAELLLKELGHAAGSQGSTASGLAKVASTLAGWSVPLAGYHQTDGSGLDRGDRVTCGLLVAIIDRSLGGSLVDGLPVAATSGTLSDQFVGSAVAGRLRAKTGTLTGARSLSGELPTEGGIVVTFSWVYNGATDSTAWQKARDAFVKVLASFPDAFDPGPYQPAPPRAATP
jgi:D-alanyl-D-alanine carboxypeptidase/D-alanyl-D-alanine-endopeptidase (penicillin-binding protein 4)